MFNRIRKIGVLSAIVVLICQAVQAVHAQDPSESLPSPYEFSLDAFTYPSVAAKVQCFLLNKVHEQEAPYHFTARQLSEVLDVSQHPVSAALSKLYLHDKMIHRSKEPGYGRAFIYSASRHSLRAIRRKNFFPKVKLPETETILREQPFVGDVVIEPIEASPRDRKFVDKLLLAGIEIERDGLSRALLVTLLEMVATAMREV